MVPADRPELPALVLAMSERIAAARRRSLRLETDTTPTEVY